MIKKWIFYASLIVFATIMFHIIPIKIVIDTKTMWGDYYRKHYKPPYPFRVDANVFGSIDSNVKGEIDVDNKDILSGFKIRQ